MTTRDNNRNEAAELEAAVTFALYQRFELRIQRTAQINYKQHAEDSGRRGSYKLHSRNWAKTSRSTRMNGTNSYSTTGL